MTESETDIVMYQLDVLPPISTHGAPTGDSQDRTCRKSSFHSTTTLINHCRLLCSHTLAPDEVSGLRF